MELSHLKFLYVMFETILYFSSGVTGVGSFDQTPRVAGVEDLYDTNRRENVVNCKIVRNQGLDVIIIKCPKSSACSARVPIRRRRKVRPYTLQHCFPAAFTLSDQAVIFLRVRFDSLFGC
ncbi:hypothetical protein WN943_000547 [Citrus x changshan-huyou]